MTLVKASKRIRLYVTKRWKAGGNSIQSQSHRYARKEGLRNICDMSRQRLEEWPCERYLWLSVWIDKHGPLKLEDMWNLTDDIVNVTTHFNIMHLPCNYNTHTSVLQFTTEFYMCCIRSYTFSAILREFWTFSTYTAYLETNMYVSGRLYVLMSVCS